MQTVTAERYRGPGRLHVDAHDASGWARTYHVIAEGRAASEAWNRAYLERNGLVELVERLEREGVGVRREPRAEGGDDE